jgi:hypothetical protein
VVDAANGKQRAKQTRQLYTVTEGGAAEEGAGGVYRQSSRMMRRQEQRRILDAAVVEIEGVGRGVGIKDLFFSLGRRQRYWLYC